MNDNRMNRLPSREIDVIISLNGTNFSMIAHNQQPQANTAPISGG